VDFSTTNSRVEAFFRYDNYTEHAIPNKTLSEMAVDLQVPTQTNDSAYNITKDFSGPLYNIPTQCLLQFSFTHPAQTSPLIGYVDHGNAA
jgi:hypothetical protein